MPYRFDLRDPTLTQALRRIAGAEIAAIRTLLGGAPDDAAVHGIRKRIKKLRALLRLLRGGLRKVQPAETVVLRDAARLLAPQRDAAVRLATLDRLLTADDGPALRALRAHLEAEAHAALPGEGSPATPPDLETLRTAIDSLALRAEGWSLHGADRRVLTEGLARAGIGAVAEIWCATDPQEIGRRYATRAQGRAPGHPGAEYVPELVDLASRATPAGTRPVLRVDTALPPDGRALAGWLRDTLGS